jgi:3-oxoadipate enol-lactonase
MKTKANGININYEVDGPEGAPWLVFSNSLATNVHMWDEQARELGKTYRVLRYDQRGHGATDAPAGRYTFEQLIADAVALMGLASKGQFRRALHARRHRARQRRCIRDHRQVIVCDRPPVDARQHPVQWRSASSSQKQGMEAVEPTVGRAVPPGVWRRAHVDKVRAMVRGRR